MARHEETAMPKLEVVPETAGPWRQLRASAEAATRESEERFRSLPDDEKRHWHDMFDYYVFQNDEEVVAHIPPDARSVLDPLTPDDDPLVLKRVVVRGNIDPTQQRITLEHGDLGTKELGGSQIDGVSVAAPGRNEYAGEPRFALGLAGTPMSAAVMKRLWPSFLAPKVRDWVVEHVVGGTVDRLDIAVNAPVVALHLRPCPVPGEGSAFPPAPHPPGRCGS